MRAASRRSLGVVVSLCFATVLSAAASTPDASAPGRRTVEVTTDEGSWMSVDVSADGKTVIFDLLGRLYSVPMGGGQAQPVGPQDQGWDLCPRFSADGSRVAFLSNRDGFTDLWIMDWASKQSRRLTQKEMWSAKDHEKYGVSRYGFACSPRWLSDGSALAAIPSTRSGRFVGFFLAESDGAHKLLEMAPVEGVRYPVATAIVPLHEKDRAAAAMTLHSATGSRRDLFWLNLDDGKINPLRDQMARGYAFNPELSRSGRLLAYIQRENKGDSALHVRDLTDGSDRKLAALSDIDEFVQEQELPGYAFTPDDAFIVIAYGGKLHKIEVKSGKDQVIPFQATVVRSVADRVRATQRLVDGPVPVKSQRWPSISNDGRVLAFSAAGAVWVRQLPDGKPRQLGASTALNTMPALSQDGRRVAYVSFEYSEEAIASRGRLLIQNLDATQAVPAIDDDASYYWPTWSPDRSKLAVIRKSSGEGTAQIGWIDVAKKTFQPLVDAPHYVSEDFRGGAPRWLAWSADGKRLFFQNFQEWQQNFRASVDVMEARLGSAPRTVARAGNDVYSIIPSPDLKQAIVVGWDQNAYVVALSLTSDEPLQISLGMPGMKRVSEIGALYPRWMNNERFTYGWTDQLFEYRLGSAAPVRKSHTELTLPRRQGDGLVAFRNARLITMAGERGVGPVIEQGTIVIKDRRIVAIGATGDVQIPAGARVIDATGLTIMPGLVDTHYHALNPETLTFYTPGSSISGGAKALAFGITTPFEAGGGSVDEASDDWRVLMESGRVLGPRWRFDSVIDTHYLRPSPDRMTIEEQRAQIRRKQDLGEGPCLKEIGDRDFIQARWRAQAAGAEGGCVIAHVEDHLMHSLARMAEGIPLHHNTLPVPMYRDVQQFLLKSDVSWTPHMELQWHIDFPQESQPRDTLPEVVSKLEQIMDADDRARFDRFYLHGKFASRIEAARKQPTDTFQRSRRPALTAVAKTLLEGGMHMTLSGHDAFGAPLRSEMLVWQDGGILREYILRAATRGGAEQLGYQNDIGSLAPGMIADLLVMKANPLEDVLNSFRLKWTVVDGAVFDSTTLKRLH
jgi:Tol biopolymer transport system component